MKHSKFTEEQVTYVLRQAEAGTAVDDICRSMGISQATFYIWKKKFGELGASEVGRLRQLEEENLRLKRLVADLTLDKSILQEVIKKDLKPSHCRALAQWIRQTYGVAIEHACKLAKLSETAWC
jgi:putative transposase